jgi:rhodanese-related sulfurtransferase
MTGETTPAELAEWLDAEEDVAVVDVRDAHAYRQGHIPGAESHPITDIDDSFLLEDWPTLVVLVDYTGDTAESAAPKVGERVDSEVTHLVGGMAAWEGDVETDY